MWQTCLGEPYFLLDTRLAIWKNRNKFLFELNIRRMDPVKMCIKEASEFLFLGLGNFSFVRREESLIQWNPPHLTIFST